MRLGPGSITQVKKGYMNILESKKQVLVTHVLFKANVANHSFDEKTKCVVPSSVRAGVRDCRGNARFFTMQVMPESEDFGFFHISREYARLKHC